MEIRSLPIGQGLAWFKQAIDLGGHNPRGVFGAALLVLVVVYAAVLAMVLPMVATLSGTGGGATAAGDAMGAVLPFVLVLVVAMSMLMPFLLGGLMHVIRETEAGRKPGALALFQPFRSGRAGALVAIGLVSMAIQMLGGAMVMASGGREYMEAYAEMMRGLMAGADPTTLAQPEASLLMFVLQLLVNYVGYAVLLFSVPSVLFLGATVGESIGASLKASVRNIGANVLAGVLLVVAMVIAALLFGLLLMLVALVASAIHPVVGAVASVVFGLLFGSALLVVVIGAAYLAWRDTFGGGTAAAAPPRATQAGFEA